MATFYISSNTNITLFIASATVSPGDVLLLENGVYQQSVLIGKDNIRLVANGSKVIFDGAGVLALAFILFGVTGVEITGITVRNYIAGGILVFGGSANRIVKNKISSTGVSGIEVFASSSNLILRNQVSEVFDGIRVAGGGVGVNFIVENCVHHCTDDGFDCLLIEDANNVFAGNTARNNQGSGFEIFGANNLVYNNCAKDNNAQGTQLVGPNTSIVGNRLRNNQQNGILAVSQNHFIGYNTVNDNEGTGIRVLNDFNIIQDNEVAFNNNNGIELVEGADRNLVLNNELKCNCPQDLLNNGENNNILQC